MNLTMQLISGTAQILPDDDEAIWTNYMGDCVSVIVAYNRDLVSDRFNNMKGFHGSGGIGNVNFDNLLAGVANETVTHIFIIPGIGNTFYPYLGLEDAKDRIRITHPKATIIEIELCNSARVYRNGNIVRNPH